MNALTYQKYRDELHGLITKGVTLLRRDERPPEELGKAAVTLERVQGKLTEDQFTIALVADFQAGKSTTFNTLADGRLLSPRGFGIKTSGCQITAQNHNGPHEHALVWWRTSKEIIAGFGDLLSPYFNRLDPERFLSDDKALDTKLDMNAPADCALVLQAAEHALAEHQARRRTFNDELLDVARCAAVTARFYSSAHLNSLRARARMTESGRLVTELKPDEIRDFVRFPLDWGIRWAAGDASRFKPEEVVFLFVAKVELYLHSASLAETGIQVLDCPGLFASKWDTEVAISAMLRADAILYLFKGITAMGKQDLKEGLGKIRELRMEPKLFYGWNVWGKTRSQSERLVAASLATMRENGFDATPDRFFQFNGRLALSALLAARHQRGTLTSGEQVILIKEEADLDVSTPTDADLVPVLSSCIKGDYKMLKGLLKEPDWTPELIEDARNESGLPQTLKAIKDFVVQNKARLILLDNGSRVVEQALEQLEGDLASRERTAQQKHDEFVREREKVGQALTKFQTDCVWVLKDLEHTQPDTRLAEEFVARLDDAWRSRLAERVSTRIYEEVMEHNSVVANLHKLFFNREALQHAVVQIFQAEFERAIQTEITSWVQQLQDGSSPAYNMEVRDRVEHIQHETLRLWHETVQKNDLEILKEIPLPHLAGNVWQAQRQMPGVDSSTTQDDVEGIIKRVGLELFGQAWSIKALIATVVVTLFAGGPPGWILAAAAVLIGIVVLKMSPDEIRQRLTEKVRQDIENNWDATGKAVRIAMESFGKGIRAWYRQTIETTIISKPRLAVEQRQAWAEDLFALTQAERERVAAHAKQLREQDIAPLRAEIVSFTQRCNTALKLPATT